MERRKFVIGLGSLAAGGAAATGTGAFSAMTADRSADINVVDDTGGLVSLHPEGEQVELDNGELVIDLGMGEGEDDFGVNVNSKYEFGEITDSTWDGFSTLAEYTSTDDYPGEPIEDGSLAEWYGTHVDDSGPVATDRVNNRDDGPAFEDDRSNDIEEPFFVVQNNDTTAHDITLTFDTEIANIIGTERGQYFRPCVP